MEESAHGAASPFGNKRPMHYTIIDSGVISWESYFIDKPGLHCIN